MEKNPNQASGNAQRSVFAKNADGAEVYYTIDCSKKSNPRKYANIEDAIRAAAKRKQTATYVRKDGYIYNFGWKLGHINEHVSSDPVNSKWIGQVDDWGVIRSW